MKKNAFTICLIVCNLHIAFSQSPQTKVKPQGDLTITVSGLKSDKGTLKIGLFQNEASWNDQEEKFRGAVITIKNRKAVWVIKSVPYGQYAIKYFHDENNDDKLNTNILGMPKETYGFYIKGSNKFIPPGFDKAKFVFQSASQLIDLKN